MIEVWILILTMERGAPAITTAEFESRQLCIDAGDRWMRQVKGYISRSTALCVPKAKRASAPAAGGE